MRKYPNTPNVNVPDGAESAASLGLKDLRIGRHHLRDEAGVRIGSIWVDTFWMLRIKPSFDHHGLLGVAAAHGEGSVGGTSPGWTKGFLASDGLLVVQELETDPLPPVLSGLPLLQRSDSLCLDGVSYLLGFRSMPVEGTLSFGNPTVPELVAVESACCDLAEKIAHKSISEPLLAFTETWRSYRKGRVS